MFFLRKREKSTNFKKNKQWQKCTLAGTGKYFCSGSSAIILDYLQD